MLYLIILFIILTLCSSIIAFKKNNYDMNNPFKHYRFSPFESFIVILSIITFAFLVYLYLKDYNFHFLMFRSAFISVAYIFIPVEWSTFVRCLSSIRRINTRTMIYLIIQIIATFIIYYYGIRFNFYNMYTLLTVILETVFIGLVLDIKNRSD